MRIGSLFAPTVETPRHIALAESLGYERAWVYDSPAIFADPWITLAGAASLTERIRIGVAATTPRLRHLVATAGAVATLQTLAPERVDVVIGAGFTSQAMIGKRPVRWEEVERFAIALRRLLYGDVIEWEGAIVGLCHSPRTRISLPAAVPIWIAAHGPRGYEVGQRVADGIVTNLGHGRITETNSSKPVYTQFPCTILREGETLASPRVVEAVGPAAALHLHLGQHGAAADLPETARFAELMATVDDRRRHLELHRNHLLDLAEVERPLISEELLRRTTNAGTPAEVRARVAELEAAGFGGLLYSPMGPDIEGELVTFAKAMGLAP
jgi:5,10-methylenetetrahydromethanopterin reductase